MLVADATGHAHTAELIGVARHGTPEVARLGYRGCHGKAGPGGPIPPHELGGALRRCRVPDCAPEGRVVLARRSANAERAVEQTGGRAGYYGDTTQIDSRD